MKFKWQGKGNTYDGKLSIDGIEIKNCERFTLEVDAVTAETKLTMCLHIGETDIVETFTENMDHDTIIKDSR